MIKFRTQRNSPPIKPLNFNPFIYSDQKRRQSPNTQPTRPDFVCFNWSTYTMTPSLDQGRCQGFHLTGKRIASVAVVTESECYVIFTVIFIFIIMRMIIVIVSSPRATLAVDVLKRRKHTMTAPWFHLPLPTEPVQLKPPCNGGRALLGWNQCAVIDPTDSRQPSSA